MVPTNRLRWIWVNDHKEAGVVYVNPPRHMVLQQWWSNDGSGPEATQGVMVADPTNTTDCWVTIRREGEWRDVEIVEE